MWVNAVAAGVSIDHAAASGASDSAGTVKGQPPSLPLLKEAFQQLWDYNSPAWAGKFLDEWCRQTMRSRRVGSGDEDRLLAGFQRSARSGARSRFRNPSL